MRARTRGTSALIAGVMLFGPVATPALAQDAPEGFTVESCGEDIALSAPEGFALDDLPADLSLEELCSIYGVEVLDVVDEHPGEQPDGVVATTEPVAPTQVLGVTLARTGIDAALIVLSGMALLGLGVVAVRRSKRDHVEL